jgi:hypothetical protein
MRIFVSILLLLTARCAVAADYVSLGTPGYDVLFDHVPSNVEVYSYDTAFDCGVPAVVTRNGRRIDIVVIALRPGGTACAGRYYVGVGQLASGWWTVAAHVAGTAGEQSSATSSRLSHTGARAIARRAPDRSSTCARAA